jgi:hypothetical protein
MAEKNEKGRKKGSYEAAAMHPAGECPSLRILSLLSFLSAELLFLGVLFTVTAILYLPSSILSSVAAEPRCAVSNCILPVFGNSRAVGTSTLRRLQIGLPAEASAQAGDRADCYSVLRNCVS